jgi:hypothetical protein
MIIVSMAGLTGRVEYGDSYVSTRPLRQAAPQNNPARVAFLAHRESAGYRIRAGYRAGDRALRAPRGPASVNPPENFAGAFTAPRNRLSDIARVQPTKHSRRCNADLLHVQSFPVGLSVDEQRTMRKVGDVQFHVGEIQNVEC